MNGRDRFSQRLATPCHTSSAATTAAFGATLSHSVSKLNVFPHRTRVRVALVAARHLTGIRLACDVCLHVLGTVTGVVESLIAVFIVTGIWLFPCMCPNMKLQIFESRK